MKSCETDPVTAHPTATALQAPQVHSTLHCPPPSPRWLPHGLFLFILTGIVTSTCSTEAGLPLLLISSSHPPVGPLPQHIAFDMHMLPPLRRRTTVFLYFLLLWSAPVLSLPSYGDAGGVLARRQGFSGPTTVQSVTSTNRCVDEVRSSDRRRLT